MSRTNQYFRYIISNLEGESGQKEAWAEPFSFVCVRTEVCDVAYRAGADEQLGLQNQCRNAPSPLSLAGRN